MLARLTPPPYEASVALPDKDAGWTVTTAPEGPGVERLLLPGQEIRLLASATAHLAKYRRHLELRTEATISTVSGSHRI